MPYPGKIDLLPQASVSTYRLVSSWTSQENGNITRGTKSQLYFTELGYRGESGSIDNENHCKWPEKYEAGLKARINIEEKIPYI